MKSNFAIYTTQLLLLFAVAAAAASVATNDDECRADACKSKKCTHVAIATCPPKHVIKLDRCGCCEECVQDPHAVEAPKLDLCLPGDCNAKTCENIDTCPQHRHLIAMDRCGCCEECVRIINNQEKCNETAQYMNKEVCEDGTKCLYGICTCDY